MKNIFTLLTMLLFGLTGYAQQRDTTAYRETEQHRMMRFISQRLNVDSVKAKQVESIQSDYKASLKRMMSNGGTSPTQKHQIIDSLARQKNRKLAAILTPEQLEKIIPGTERPRLRSPKN